MSTVPTDVYSFSVQNSILLSSPSSTWSRFYTVPQWLMTHLILIHAIAHTSSVYYASKYLIYNVVIPQGLRLLTRSSWFPHPIFLFFTSYPLRLLHIPYNGLSDQIIYINVRDQKSAVNPLLLTDFARWWRIEWDAVNDLALFSPPLFIVLFKLESDKLG